MPPFTASEPPPACRVFPFEVRPGAWNMACDEGLLDLVAGDPAAAAFRVYAWSEPTLSLGYFQTMAEAEADPRWRGVPLVRRPTGGGALWHHHEITYAFVVPHGHPLARRAGGLYRAVHEALAQALAARGVGAARRGEVSDSDGPRPFLCFADRDSNDLVVGSAKVVGSAQRRRAGAVLQHGSVLLAGSPVTPELPGVADLAPAAGSAGDWAEALAAELPAALGFRARPEPWPGGFLDAVDARRQAVYDHPGWTRRR